LSFVSCDLSSYSFCYNILSSLIQQIRIQLILIVSSPRQMWPYLIFKIFRYPVWALWYNCSQNFKLFRFPIFRFWASPDEGYFERTWWRLLSVPDEGYWAYLIKVIERTWWRFSWGNQNAVACLSTRFSNLEMHTLLDQVGM
jgi:hypothetical protein